MDQPDQLRGQSHRQEQGCPERNRQPQREVKYSDKGEESDTDSRAAPLASHPGQEGKHKPRRQQQDRDSQRDHPGEVISHPVEVEINEPLPYHLNPEIEKARDQPDPGCNEQRRVPCQAAGM